MENKHMQNISFVVLRTMSSLIFITAGLNHLFQTAAATARLEQATLGYLATWVAPAETLIILSGMGLLVGGLLLLAGFKTRLAALLLLALLIPITVTVQVADAGGPLFKNIALLGVLFFFLVNGAAHYSVDQLLALRKKGSLTSERRFKAVLGIGLMLLLGATVTAQATAPAAQGTSRTAAKTNYAVLISQPNHLKAAVNTAQALRANSKYNAGEVVVMACSKSVEAFKKGSSFAKEFEAGKQAGVTYRLCGMSLEQFGIQQSQLLEGVEVVPNGLTHMIDLQLEGYTTVEL